MALNNFRVHTSVKDCIKKAKNVAFFHYAFWSEIDRQWGPLTKLLIIISLVLIPVSEQA